MSARSGTRKPESRKVVRRHGTVIVTSRYPSGRTTVRRYPASYYNKPFKPGKKRSAAGATAGKWITGRNDEMPSCVATAVANSLLAQTGVRVTDQDVMILHRISGGGDGVSIASVLRACFNFGIGGHRPASYQEGLPELSRPVGMVIGLTDGFNDHAVTMTEQGLISWGAPMSDRDAQDWMADGEAWHIDWQGA